jgi:Flp pilus assembly protein TadG
MPSTSSKRDRHGRQGGMMVLLMAALLLFLIPVIGLVVDCSLIYFVRTRITAAVDASALATARSLNLGQTLAEQNAAAVARGKAFFWSNFPSGTFSTRNTTITIPDPQYGTTSSTLQTIYVTTTGQTDAPTYFMNIFNIDHVTIKVTGQAARRNINLILVLDKSGSMNNTDTPTACEQMKTAAKNFVTYFSNNRDTLGIVAYNAAYYNTFAPSSSFLPDINTAITNISCVHGTNVSAALNRAYTLLQGINQPSALNVIVLFTDGQPTVFTADFPVKKLQDTRYGDGNTAKSSTAPNSKLYPAATYGSLVTVPPSPCKDPSGRQWYKSPTYITGTNPYPSWNPFSVVLTNGAGATAGTVRGGLSYGGNPIVGGYVYGLYNWVENYNLISTSGSCAFQTTDSNNNYYSPRRDVAYIPDTDLWGNATVGYHTNYLAASNSYSGNDYMTYNGTSRVRADSAQTISNVSFNVTDAQASTIRADTTLKPVIYTIGLGTTDIDTMLLIRVANVQSATDPSGATVTNAIYTTTQNQGLYAWAPNSTQLNQAFALIASSVLRLSR